MLPEPLFRRIINTGQLQTLCIILLVVFFAFISSLFLGKKFAEEAAQRTKLAYERALAQYSLAQSEIQHLSKNYKKDIVLEDYEFFICNLSTLTPTEYKIYELYLDGKDAKEIIKIMGFTENTLKYHNKNIYSKLGISSRKQLLRFATLKQHQDKIGSSADFNT